MHWHMTEEIGRNNVHSWNYFLCNQELAMWSLCCVLLIYPYYYTSRMQMSPQKDVLF